jgi:hypothetical protein
VVLAFGNIVSDWLVGRLAVFLKKKDIPEFVALDH